MDAAHKTALRDSFVSALRKFASGPRVLLVQISLALSGLALQMSEWKSVLPDLVASLGRDPETVPALLEFLRVLPEEATGNTRIPMSVSPICQPLAQSRASALKPISGRACRRPTYDPIRMTNIELEKLSFSLTTSPKSSSYSLCTCRLKVRETSSSLI